MRARGTNIGMPGARWATIRALAAAEHRDALLSQTRPLDEALEALMSIKGIGPWTAHYIAMRALDHPDAFPAGDLGIRKAMNFNDNELRKRSDKWRPYRAYAAMLLWQA